MEPMNITAHLREGRCEVWAPSQAADAMRSVIAKELELAESSVTVHTTLMGGGFGRRYQYDFPAEVAQIAKHVEVPVQLVWTREDDMTHDFYRPAGMRRMRGALDTPRQYRSVVGSPGRRAAQLSMGRTRQTQTRWV